MAAIHYEATYPAPVERVMSLLTDEEFLTAYAKEVGALAYQVGIERGDGDPTTFQVRTRVLMTVPTAGVPAVLKRLVPPTIDLTEVRTWDAPVDGRWRGALAVDASARSREAKVRAGLVLESGADGSSRFGVDGVAKVDVPLLGDMAGSLVADLVGSVIKRQSAVMERWLREG
jgi:uncharacterized protein YndB with AHSA1/START domain